MLHHPFLFGEIQRSAQEVARRISGAVAREVRASQDLTSNNEPFLAPTQKSTYQVPITILISRITLFSICLSFSSPPLHPCCFIRPLSLSSLSFSICPFLPACFLFACVLDCLLVVMASPLSSPLSPENEVLNFKKREGENLKDAWYRIFNAQNRSTRKQSTSVLLRNF